MCTVSRERKQSNSRLCISCTHTRAATLTPTPIHGRMAKKTHYPIALSVPRSNAKMLKSYTISVHVSHSQFTVCDSRRTFRTRRLPMPCMLVCACVCVCVVERVHACSGRLLSVYLSGFVSFTKRTERIWQPTHVCAMGTLLSATCTNGTPKGNVEKFRNAFRLRFLFLLFSFSSSSRHRILCILRKPILNLKQMRHSTATTRRKHGEQRSEMNIELWRNDDAVLCYMYEW